MKKLKVVLLMLLVLCVSLPLVYAESLTGEDGNVAQTAERVAAENVERNTLDLPDAMTKQADFVFSYAPNQIYKVYCQEGRLTDIQLQPGEEILFVGGGDTVRWMVDQAQSGSGDQVQWHVYVKPLKAGLKTNMVINTDKHSYHLSLEATDWFTPIVNWAYPHEERAAFLRKQQEEEKIAKETIVLGEDSIVNFEPENLNFKYRISSKKKYSWTPELVFDDGIKTYIKMPKTMFSGEAPALFIKEGKSLLLVNYRVKNNYYIIDRIFQHGELRCGKEVVKIYRK
ncbi:MAG TPA: P-type conjugative transfer protein TrbG [Bacillota bacterium]|jgi:P-type conjugative transfer protein TrbG|nr:P-type conjugative transfer protein TrbG [Bacillota bacterium]HOL09887.1 P-type conjugative transfer protein TrbG [Bacillota bacterium]HPO98664.1 P-type conjugative transfer protein TrbG [Bacillota bacterium]